MSKEKSETKICKHCQSEIPKKAKVCPVCRKKQGPGGCLIAIVIFLLIGLIGSCFGGGGSGKEEKAETKAVVSEAESSSKETTQEEKTIEETTEEETEPETISEEEYKSLCAEYNYKDVLRNPENYVGEKIKITVKVSTVHEAGFTNPTKYYFAYTNDKYDMWMGDRYAIYDKRENQDPKLLSDDIIVVWGEIADTEQTSSLIVNSEEVFVIDMKYVELIGE